MDSIDGGGWRWGGGWRNELYKEKTPLAVGQPQTHFYSDSMVIEPNALKGVRKSHC